MTLDKAVQIAKSGPEQKVGFSMQIPLSLKEKFEQICKDRGVTMTSLLQAYMQIAIEEEERKYAHLDDDELSEQIESMKKYVDDLRADLKKGIRMRETAIDEDEYGELIFDQRSVSSLLTDAKYHLHLLLAEQQRREKEKQ